MYLLVCNVGSTSLKFKLFSMPDTRHLAEGKIERVGSRDDAIFHYGNRMSGFEVKRENCCVPTYTAGIQMFLSHLTDGEHGALEDVKLLERVGFKTALAKGYYGVHPLTGPVLAAMEECLPIAPVHNVCYLEAIRQFQRLLPGVPLVGVFETAFHITIPLERRLYGLPYEWYETYGIQRIGYHGASHAYVAAAIAEREEKSSRIISCHLGGSCSISAIRDGESVDNSFGFSLQTGLPHANRVGDMDAYILPFLRGQGLSEEEIMAGLEKEGGLKGISGVSGDLRHIEAAAAGGNRRAQLAIDLFADAVVRYTGSAYAVLGGLDHLVFTGGIGENDFIVRDKVCGKLGHLGVVLDESANKAGPPRRRISASGSPVGVHIIPANEELVVARKTYECQL